MDSTTADHRAWALAPHLVVVDASATSAGWCNPETGTVCRLDAQGEYVVLRQVAGRTAPVVAGQLAAEEAAPLVAEPDSLRARRAAAHAIMALDGGTPR